jgi:hypothetical protein
MHTKVYVVVKPEGKTPLARTRSRWEDTIQMILKKKGVRM